MSNLARNVSVLGPDTGADRASDAPTEGRAIALWRATLFDRLLRYSFTFSLLTLVVLGRQEVEDSSWELSPALLITTAGLGVAAWGRTIDRRLRATTFIVALLLSCTVALASGAFWAPNAFIAIAMAATVLSLGPGRAYAWATLAAFLVAMLVVAALFVLGHLSPDPSQHDPRLVQNWARVFVIYTAAVSVIILAVSFLTQRLEEAVRRNGELYRGLAIESSQKIQALETRREMEIRLHDSQKIEALGRLAGGVAHDFNNLLVVIINNAFLLRETASDAQSQGLQDIEDAGYKAAELARQLLSFSRQPIGAAAWLDFDEAVSSSFRMLRRLLPASVTVESAFDAAGAGIRAVPVQVDQVLMNLVLNARDAMPEGGALRVSTRVARHCPAGSDAERDFIELCVRDDGEGMSEEVRARIFEPFFTTKRVGEGTGLGLSVVRGSVEQHGGFVEVRSVPGEGTTVSAHYPVVPRPVASELPVSRRPTARAATGGETLLVVDDDAAVLKILEQLLAAAGYRVIACKDGLEALEAYARHSEQIRLVVTDAIMPNLGGRGLYDELHPKDPGLCFLFCSGYASGTLPPEFFDDPTRELIAKPFGHDELLLKVRALLDRS